MHSIKYLIASLIAFAVMASSPTFAYDKTTLSIGTLDFYDSGPVMQIDTLEAFEDLSKITVDATGAQLSMRTCSDDLTTDNKASLSNLTKNSVSRGAGTGIIRA